MIGNIIMMLQSEFDTSAAEMSNLFSTLQSRERCSDQTFVPTIEEPFGQHIIIALAKATLKHIWT